MSQLFISYSRSDSAAVDALTKRLEEQDFDVWIDRQGIEGGTQWRREIVDAIETCDAFILVLSPRSVASKNVRREVDLAETSERRIIPVLIEPTTLTPDLRYQLSGIQMIDLPDLSTQWFGILMKALGAEEKKPAAAPRRQAVDLSQSDGGALFSKLARFRFSRRG